MSAPQHVARRHAPCRCSSSSTAPAARRFLLTNPDGYSLTYNGLVMAVEKRRSNGWQAFGSYTFSRAVGLQASSGTTAAGAQSQHRRRSRTCRSGAIPTISPTRAAGCQTIARTCSAPWARWTCRGPASWSRPICSIFSGKPWASTAQVVLPQGDQRILLEPRGSRRLSSQSLLDVRVSRTIRFGGAGRIDLLLDVLNALNDTAEEGLATENLFSTNFGQPTSFMDPRRAMVGVRLNLGR